MSWIQRRSSADTLVFVREVSNVLAKNGPMAASLSKLVDSGDFKSVVDFVIDYKNVSDVDDLRATRQIQALFSKQEDDWFGYGANMEQVAYRNFLKAEQRCQETNIRLDSTRPSGRVSVISHYAVRKISAILGEVPLLTDLPFAFGPGASTNVKSVEANACAKLDASPVCSEDMLAFVGEFLAEFPYLTEHHCTKGLEVTKLVFNETEPSYDRYFDVLVQVGSGKLTFVPKSVKTKRPIVVEPILNGLAQKGVGSYIRDRLKRTCNLDLRDQTRNRELARRGSIDGSLATIDLSNASDTVSISAVFELLPPDWVDFLGRFRTGEVIRHNQTHELHKWSSMGNGYTFELESLIFYGLVYGTCVAAGWDTQDISVYGDDIIIPVHLTQDLIEALTWYGFEVNTEKSYWEGPFRESCGADWFLGNDIRPFYLKNKISDQSLYSFHNWAMRNCERELAAIIHDWTFPPGRLYGPDGYGDGHLIGSFTLRSNRVSRRSKWEGGFFDTYSLVPKRLKKRRPGDWLHPTYSIYTRGDSVGRYWEENPPVAADIVRGNAGYHRLSIYSLATSIFGRAP
jgi:hypothetical protein